MMDANTSSQPGIAALLDSLSAGVALNTSIYETCYFLTSDYLAALPPELQADYFAALNLPGARDPAALVQSLAALQNDDGSWSSDLRLDFAPDKVITTLIVLRAIYAYLVEPVLRDWDAGLLDEAGYRARLSPLQTRFDRAGGYLRENIFKVLTIGEAKKTFACEAYVLIHLQALERAMERGGEDLGFDAGLPDDMRVYLSEMRLVKLREKIGGLYDRHSTLRSLLDALEGIDVDWHALSQFLITYHGEDGTPRFTMGLYHSSTLAWMSGLLASFDPRDLRRQWEMVAGCAEMVARETGVAFTEAAAQASHELPVSDTLRLILDVTLSTQRTIRETAGFTSFHPTDYFVKGWVLRELLTSPLAAQSGDLAALDRLLPDVPASGLGVDDGFIPDVDSSAIISTVKIMLGRDVSLDWLREFYVPEKGTFICYPRENRTSPTAISHALMAIVKLAQTRYSGAIPPAYRTMFDGALDYLLRFTRGARYHADDKWHASNAYATGHVIELFCETLTLPDDQLTEEVRRCLVDAIDGMCAYLMNERKPDGGFSTINQDGSTVEETSYAVRALLRAAQQLDVRSLSGEQGRAAYDFLAASTETSGVPLWLAKTVYGSYHLTEAVRLSALAMLEEAGYGPDGDAALLLSNQWISVPRFNLD